MIFGGMAQRFRPERAGGFEGEIQYELRGAEGVHAWVVLVEGESASVRPGRAAAPALTIRAGLADFARLATRELDPGKAMMSGRLELDGDFEVAAKLSEMFGEPSRY